MIQDQAAPPPVPERDNLTRLLNLGRRKRPRINRRYSAIVRSLRLVLPLVALIIVTIVIAWPRMDETLAPIPRDDIIAQPSIGKNELINPHFESTHSDQQPYVITADRAVQSQKEESLILLEQPKADVTMAGGDIVHARSERGAYRQDSQILVMDENVLLKHDTGYQLRSERMTVSMRDQTAWTDLPVDGEGPSGTLQATAMNANNATGKIIFSGPAKMIILQTEKGLLP